MRRSSVEAPPRAPNTWSWEDGLPAVSGLLLALAFAPTSLWWLAFVGLVPLLIYLDHSPNLRRTIRGGVIFAVVLYGFTLNWLAGMVQFSWLCVPAYLFVVFLFACGFFVFIISVVALRSYLSLPFWCTVPFAWVACERLRGYGDLSFPWSNLGYTLTSVPFLVQFADIGGVYGVSFWLVLINCLLFEIITAHKNRRGTYPYVMACIAVIFCALSYDGMRWIKGPASAAAYKEVAVVQPNIPQKLKWDDRYARQNLAHLLKMSALAATPDTDLLVWPETAIPYYIDESRQFRLTELGPRLPGNEYILTGLLTSARVPTGEIRYFNAASLFNPHGDMLATYKKIDLVPGSEKYPFRGILGFTRAFFSIQDVSYGAMDPGSDFTVFQIPGAKFSVLICYESVYPQLARQFRLRGANFLVNISNDAWFGRSFAPYQHASFLVLRAIENRTAIVRCGNTGISGFVDELGRWHQKTSIFSEATIRGKVPVTSTLTFYTRCGDLIVNVSYAALGIFFLAALKKKSRASQGAQCTVI